MILTEFVMNRMP